MTKKHLALDLLGTPQIRLNDQHLTHFNTRKDRALLFYLAVTGAAHSREHLAGLLWSDIPERKARRNLRDSLSMLRKVLGAEWIEAGKVVGLTRKLTWSVDTQQLRSTLNNLGNRSDIKTLEPALTLYRGEFLQGFHVRDAALFEEWVVQQREELRLLTLQGLERLVELCSEAGDYAAGIAATRRLLTLEPWSESAHCLQMRLLAQNGQRTAALAQYEQCRRILADELSAEPMPETTELYRKIQAGQYSSPFSHREISASDALVDELSPRDQMRDANHASVPHNLFTPLAGFVGRQDELAFISGYLDAADRRLLTIAGPGGMGKTSLALAVGQQLLPVAARDFPDGIFWVPLANVGTTEQGLVEQTAEAVAAAGELILHAIADQIGGQLEVKLSSTTQLHSYVRTRRLLLILDDFEHLLGGVDALVTLLTQAPDVKMLVTSRVRLNLRGETVLTLGKLSLPPENHPPVRPLDQPSLVRVTNDDAWQASDAVAMFAQRAQQIDLRFVMDAETIDPVAQICRHVEGLPLGIELAASMLPLLGCKKLAEELTRSLDFLETDARDIPREQRTLRAVFEGSWQLLAPEEQQLLARLSIFPGSFHLDAATKIAGASVRLLRRLIDHSLVNKVDKERLTLHRTVQEFARRKLQQWHEQFDSLRVQYARYYLTFVERLEDDITGAESVNAMALIQTDLDNVHTAWRRAVTHQLYGEINRCISVFVIFYEQSGFYHEALTVHEHALSHLEEHGGKEEDTAGSDPERILLTGRLLTLISWYNLRLGRLQPAQATYEASWSILQQLNHPIASAQSLLLRCYLLSIDDLKLAEAHGKECLRLIQASQVLWMQTLSYQIMGELTYILGRYEEAEAYVEKGLAVAREIGWPRGIASGHQNLARLNLLRGRYRQAEAHLRESLTLVHQHQHIVLYLISMVTMGETLRLRGQLIEAKATFMECRKVAHSAGAGMHLAPVFWEEGCLAEQCGEYQEAKALLNDSLSIGLPPWWNHALPTLGWALIGLGELEEALVYFQEVLTRAEAQERIPVALEARLGVATVSAVGANVDQGSVVGEIGAWLVGKDPIVDLANVIEHVRQHPAATQQTRDRIARIAAEFDLQLNGVEKSRH